MDSKSNVNPLHKKVDKILNSEVDLDTLHALKNVSDLIPDNTLITRRNLRSNIETQSILINNQFAESFNEIYENFQKLRDSISFIDNCCQNLMHKIEELKFQTSDFSSQAQNINLELLKLNENEKTLNKFLEEFTLSPNELEAINSDKVDENFFNVLNKISIIHEKAKRKLANNQLMTGIEIMDSMAKYEEMAIENLYNQIVKILRTINLDFIELHSNLFNSLAYLQKKDVWFKHCMDEYTIVRRSAVAHAFIEALTRGRSSNNTHYQAMELYSNDIVRYIRDMMASLHQIFVSERDMLKTLLKACDQEELVKNNVVKYVMSSLAEGVIRILKIRVENCLVSNDRVTDVQSSSNQIKRIKNFFWVKHTINFYLQTFNLLLNEDSEFMFFIAELLVSCDKLSYNSLKFYCSQLGQKTCTPLHSSAKSSSNIKLISKEQSQHYTTLIEELMECIKCSMAYSKQEQQLETERVLTCIFEPCLQYIIISSSKFSPIEMTIFKLNCFIILKQAIERHPYTESFQKNLQKQIDESMEILINEQFQFIINSLSATSLHNAINQNQFIQSNQVQLSTLSGCDPITVATFLTSFDKFINNPEQSFMKRLEEINDVIIRDNIWNNSLKLLISTYEKIYKLLVDPENKYTDIIDSIKHKPEDIQSLIIKNNKK